MSDFKNGVRSNFSNLESDLTTSRDISKFCESIPRYYEKSLGHFNDHARKFLEGIVETKKEKFSEIADYNRFQYCYGIRETYLKASRLFDALLDLSIDIYSCENENEYEKEFDAKDYDDLRSKFILMQMG